MQNSKLVGWSSNPKFSCHLRDLFLTDHSNFVLFISVCFETLTVLKRRLSMVCSTQCVLLID